MNTPFKVQLKKSKEFDRTFNITAPNKIDAYSWGERQAKEFDISPVHIEVFDVKS